MKTKLTVKAVEKLKPAARDVILWDEELANFGIKITPAGRRSYLIYYRTREGQQRRPGIGTYPSLRPEAAREIARDWLTRVAQGEDPSRDRAAHRTAPTVRDLCSRYLEEHARTRKKQSSIRNDERLINAHINRALGARKATSVDRADIAAIHQSLRKTPYEANRMLALASKMFGLAERWGVRPDGSNPAKNIDRYKEKKRDRYLSDAELKRLWETLESSKIGGEVSLTAIAAIKLLILTGRRLSEILGLKWSYVDLDARTMRFPDTKTGPLLVSIGRSAVDLLLELRERASSGTVYVFGGRGHGQPLVNLQKPWRRVRASAGLHDVRLHDLRHTFGGIAAGLGMSLPLIGRLLGHSSPATTARYAHVAQNPVRLAADTINEAVERSIRSGT